MISVICIFNDRQMLEETLLNSLERQTTDYELLVIDNRDNHITSAGEGLNAAAAKAKGDYLMFTHQDVFLGSAEWLEEAEKYLDHLDRLGVAGCAGIDDLGTRRGYIRDRYKLWGSPLRDPVKVQTLDECVLMVPRTVFARLRFDETSFKGWHCYGADYCLSVGRLNLKAYVIPCFIHHNSPNLNMPGLAPIQKSLYSKHNRNFRKIYTTSGMISSWTMNTYSAREAALRLYTRLFPQFYSDLKTRIEGRTIDCRTVLDIGWMRNYPIRALTAPGALEDELISIDYESIAILVERRFDAVIALDVVEHLNREDFLRFVKRMENLALKRIIVFCRNPILEEANASRTPGRDSHWSYDDIGLAGFQIEGVQGLRALKRIVPESGSMEVLGTVILDASRTLSSRWPEHANQLLLTKWL